MVVDTCAILLLAVFVLLLYFINRWYRSGSVPDVTSKHVFITGTDSGFGRKLALELESKGMTVYAGCYTENGSEDLKKIASSRLHVLRIDVTKLDTIVEAKAFIEKHLPAGKGLWGLVNNAGILGDACFDFCTVDDFKTVMDVNFFGPVMVTQTFLPLIKKARGRIINVISVFGRGSVGFTPYCSSKFAMEPYSDGLRRAMKTFRVHVATIEPGFFRETGLVNADVWADGLERQWRRLPEDIKQEYGEEYRKFFPEFLKRLITFWPMVSFNKASFVTSAMQHALLAIHPKARYLCGYDARLFVIFTNVMPDWFLDAISRFSSAYFKVAYKV